MAQTAKPAGYTLAIAHTLFVLFSVIVKTVQIS